MKRFAGLLGLLLTATTLANLNSDNVKVIYGEDNRHDAVDYTKSKVVEASRSTVALVKASTLTVANGLLSVSLTTFAEKMQLCEGEPFAEQPAPAFCSGFLVAPNKIMTAGHCIKSADDCSQTRFLFDFRLEKNQVVRTDFAEDQVYSCKKVLGWKKEDAGIDYAIIELDRPVVGRTPLTLSNNRKLKPKKGVLVIGHPSGLPTKITDEAKVRVVRTSEGYFMANLDTYGGNSGSAVLNAKTLEVEGILVRGEKDFSINASEDCRYSYHTQEDSGRGEDVTLITAALENGAPAEVSTGFRYVWLDSDHTCNLFNGTGFVSEVAATLCGRGTPAVAVPDRYVWLDTDQTCNLFSGDHYVREVADNLCGHR